jgi:sugar phosphate isomerase/epimerase
MARRNHAEEGALALGERIKMRICISSWSFHNAFENGLVDVISFPGFCKREFKVNEIELFDPDFFCSPDPVPTIMDISPEDPHIEQVKNACDDSGVSIVAIAAQNDFSNPDQEKRQSDIDRVKRWIEIAAALAVPIIRINSGIWFCDAKHDGAPRLVEALKDIGPVAKETGIILAIENHPQNVNSVAEAERLVSIATELTDFKVATCPDTGHISGRVWGECLDELFAAARHCHVKFTAFDEQGEETGIDYAAFFTIARQKDYRGSISIELVPPPRAGPLVWFKVAPATMERMKEDGVPTKVVERLRSIEGQVFQSKAKLDAATAQCLGDEEAAKRESIIMSHVERLAPDFELRKEEVRKAVKLLIRNGARL